MSAYIDKLVSKMQAEIDDILEHAEAQIKERELAIERLVAGAEPAQPPASAPVTPRPRRKKTKSRCGLTPEEMLECCSSAFGRKGFTVNEFVSRMHWEPTSTRKEGARQLLQALVSDGLVTRGSRVDPGYKTEVEYSVLAPPEERDVDQAAKLAGRILANLRGDVRLAVSRAVEAGWAPTATSCDGVFRFTHPRDRKRSFLVEGDPQGDSWRDSLRSSMSIAGAPA